MEVIKEREAQEIDGVSQEFEPEWNVELFILFEIQKLKEVSQNHIGDGAADQRNVEKHVELFKEEELGDNRNGHKHAATKEVFPDAFIQVGFEDLLEQICLLPGQLGKALFGWVPIGVLAYFLVVLCCENADASNQIDFDHERQAENPEELREVKEIRVAVKRV